MKCETIYGWLLATRGGVPLPPGVERHLDRCRACRRRRFRLLRLEQGLRTAPIPPSEPAALERLLQRLEQAPGPVARSNGAVRVWRPAVWAAVAAAIAETGATSAKDVGKVMKAVMPKLAGKNADGRTINEAVRRKLGA